MPCYRCGARQGDPAPGKPSSWHQGVVAQPPAGEHQVLICPDCYPSAQPALTRCPGCGGTRLVKRLDQVECLGCQLTRDVLAADPAGNPPAPPTTPAPPSAPAPSGSDSTLAAEVAAALDRILRDKSPGP